MTMKNFLKVTPESVGISSQALLCLMQRLSKLEYINSIMILRHGKLCLEAWMKPYERNMVHQLFSLSKSFTSCAIGIAQGEGLLSIHDKLVKFYLCSAYTVATNLLRCIFQNVHQYLLHTALNILQ